MKIKEFVRLFGIVIMCGWLSACVEDLLEEEDAASLLSLPSTSSVGPRACPTVDLPECKGPQLQAVVLSVTGRLFQYNGPGGCAMGAGTDEECLRFCRSIQEHASDIANKLGSDPSCTNGSDGHRIISGNTPQQQTVTPDVTPLEPSLCITEGRNCYFEV